jgi:hypothetical protein
MPARTKHTHIPKALNENCGVNNAPKMAPPVKQPVIAEATSLTDQCCSKSVLPPSGSENISECDPRYVGDYRRDSPPGRLPVSFAGVNGKKNNVARLGICEDMSARQVGVRIHKPPASVKNTAMMNMPRTELRAAVWSGLDEVFAVASEFEAVSFPICCSGEVVTEAISPPRAGPIPLHRLWCLPLEDGLLLISAVL